LKKSTNLVISDRYLFIIFTYLKMRLLFYWIVLKTLYQLTAKERSN
jgi:hypothetical protein